MIVITLQLMMAQVTFQPTFSVPSELWTDHDQYILISRELKIDQSVNNKKVHSKL